MATKTMPALQPNFLVKPLEAATWPDFAAPVERHNGVWGEPCADAGSARSTVRSLDQR